MNTASYIIPPAVIKVGRRLKLHPGEGGGENQNFGRGGIGMLFGKPEKILRQALLW